MPNSSFAPVELSVEQQAKLQAAIELCSSVPCLAGPLGETEFVGAGMRDGATGESDLGSSWIAVIDPHSDRVCVAPHTLDKYEQTHINYIVGTMALMVGMHGEVDAIRTIRGDTLDINLLCVAMNQAALHRMQQLGHPQMTPPPCSLDPDSRPLHELYDELVRKHAPLAEVDQIDVQPAARHAMRA